MTVSKKTQNRKLNTGERAVNGQPAKAVLSVKSVYTVNPGTVKCSPESSLDSVYLIDRPGKYNISFKLEKSICLDVRIISLVREGICEISAGIEHLASDSRSRIACLALVAGELRFRGKIIISGRTAATRAEMENYSVLIRQGAAAVSAPALTVGSPDTQCSHKAVVFRPEEEAVFYLQSRGIPRVRAMRILAEGFVNSQLEGINPEIQSSIIENIKLMFEHAEI